MYMGGESRDRGWHLGGSDLRNHGVTKIPYKKDIFEMIFEGGSFLLYGGRIGPPGVSRAREAELVHSVAHVVRCVHKPRNWFTCTVTNKWRTNKQVHGGRSTRAVLSVKRWPSVNSHIVIDSLNYFCNYFYRKCLNHINKVCLYQNSYLENLYGSMNSILWFSEMCSLFVKE